MSWVPRTFCGPLLIAGAISSFARRRKGQPSIAVASAAEQLGLAPAGLPRPPGFRRVPAASAVPVQPRILLRHGIGVGDHPLGDMADVPGEAVIDIDLDAGGGTLAEEGDVLAHPGIAAFDRFAVERLPMRPA